MEDQFKNKIRRLELENFTCFSKLDIEFSSSINVLIGENGTGKTHLLKALYASVQNTKNLNGSTPSMVSLLGDNKAISRDSKLDTTVKIIFNNSSVSRKYLNQYHSPVISNNPNRVYLASTLYIPTHEMLSWFNGFIASYENRESSIDATYYYLAKALAPLPLKGERLQEVKGLITELETAIDAKVVRKSDKFYIAFNNDNSEFESSMVAEGINKISQLIYLIMNGALTKETVLFWDEPEVNLNPKYIVLISKFLQTLAYAGVQIFVATHDYLLAHRLSFTAEYKESNNKTPDIKFFSFYKNGEGTQVESAESLAGLEHNTILDEYAALYDFEEQLFVKSTKK